MDEQQEVFQNLVDESVRNIVVANQNISGSSVNTQSRQPQPTPTPQNTSKNQLFGGANPQSQPQSQPQSKPAPYVFGRFSNFAVQKQKQINEIQEFIQKTIKQAMYSHLNLLHQMSIANKQWNQHNQVFDKIKKQFGENQADWSLIDKYLNFVKNPIQYTIEQNIKKQTTNVKQIMTNYVKRRFLMNKLALIQSKFIKIDNIVFGSNFVFEGVRYIPTNDKRIFIKIGVNQLPSIVFFDGLTFKTKQQLAQLTPFDRNQIITMVQMFLKQNGIIRTQQQILMRMNKLIDVVY